MPSPPSLPTELWAKIVHLAANSPGAKSLRRAITERLHFLDPLRLVSSTFGEIARRERLDTIIVDSTEEVWHYTQLLYNNRFKENPAVVRSIKAITLDGPHWGVELYAPKLATDWKNALGNLLESAPHVQYLELRCFEFYCIQFSVDWIPSAAQSLRSLTLEQMHFVEFYHAVEFSNTTSLTLRYCEADNTPALESFLVHFTSVRYLEDELSSVSAMRTFGTTFKDFAETLEELHWRTTIAYEPEIPELGEDVAKSITECGKLRALQISAETLVLASAAKLPARLRVLNIGDEDDPLPESTSKYLDILLRMVENLEVLRVPAKHFSDWERALGESTAKVELIGDW